MKSRKKADGGGLVLNQTHAPSEGKKGRRKKKSVAERKKNYDYSRQRRNARVRKTEERKKNKETAREERAIPA